MEEPKQIKEIKILLLGETNVGKTSIFNRFIYNKYKKVIGSTIGVDFETKTIKYKNNSYLIRLFDTAGQERFRSISQNFYLVGEAYFIVFDLTNENSLNAIPYWINSLKEKTDNYNNIIILGNKDDLKNQIPNEVINEQLKQFSDKIYIKTSAEKNTNIGLAFEKMIDLINNDNNNHQINNSFNLEKKAKKKIEDNKVKCC